jgi:hypothetical protein
VRQMNATKKLYLRRQGVVTGIREVPDHAVQFRASVELAKLYGVYPRKGERGSDDPFDRSELPLINLVIHGPERRTHCGEAFALPPAATGESPARSTK